MPIDVEASPHHPKRHQFAAAVLLRSILLSALSNDFMMLDLVSHGSSGNNDAKYLFRVVLAAQSDCSRVVLILSISSSFDAIES